MREKLNMNRPQLSNLLGIPIRTIENWESGISKCPTYVELLIIEKLENIYLNNKDGNEVFKKKEELLHTIIFDNGQNNMVIATDLTFKECNELISKLKNKNLYKII